MSAVKGRYLKTRELARQLGVSVSSVKSYTRRGILRFKRKSKNAYRVFISREDRHDSDVLRRLKALGCDLERIRTGRLDSVVNRVDLERAVLNFQKKPLSRDRAGVAEA